MSAWEHLPRLGVGLGFRESLRADVFRRRGSIDFLEITTDHYLDAPPEKLAELQLLQEHFSLIPHGLDLSLGSAEGLDHAYLDQVAGLIERIDPPWWSEHVAFTRAGGYAFGHLAPLPFSGEALDALCRNVEQVRSRIRAPLILENITYTLDLGAHETSEAAFLRELCEQTGCGLLLDVTNLSLNARRHRYDEDVFLKALPLDRVIQLHFVGAERVGDEWADTHGAAMSDELWELFRRVATQAPNLKGAVLERDKNFPPFDEIVAELDQARSLLQGTPAGAAR